MLLDLPLVKRAVGANARRIAQAIHANPSAPGLHRLAGFQTQVPKQTAARISRLLGNAEITRNTTAGAAQQEARAIGEMIRRTPARAVSPQDANQLDQDLVRRSLSGRHGANRRLYTAEELASQPSAADLAFRGFSGQGTPFQGRPSAGSPLFAAGQPGSAIYYGIPDISVGTNSSAFGPYFSKLRVPDLERVGPSGPWTPHLAMDTRHGFGKLFARVMNSTGLGRLAARGTANVPGASSPKFERVFTAPNNLMPQTQEAYKYLGNVNGQPSFMRVFG